MVLDVTALCGLIKDTNNLDSPPRSGPVLSKYALRVLTGQSTILDGNLGKKNSSIGFPWRDCCSGSMTSHQTHELCMYLFVYNAMSC